MAQRSLSASTMRLRNRKNLNAPVQVSKMDSFSLPTTNNSQETSTLLTRMCLVRTTSSPWKTVQANSRGLPPQKSMMMNCASKNEIIALFSSAHSLPSPSCLLTKNRKINEM